MYFLIVQFTPCSSYIISLEIKYFPHLFELINHPCSSLNIREHILYPQQNKTPPPITACFLWMKLHNSIENSTGSFHLIYEPSRTPSILPLSSSIISSYSSYIYLSPHFFFSLLYVKIYVNIDQYMPLKISLGYVVSKFSSENITSDASSKHLHTHSNTLWLLYYR